MVALRTLAACILLTGCFSPTVTSAEAHFEKYADSAMVVYSQFEKPSIKQSNDYWNFITASWKDNKCNSIPVCMMEGRAAGEEYAKLMRVKLTNEI